MATKTVRYIFEEPFGEIKEVQVKVGTVDLLGVGEHAKLRRMYQLHTDTLAGKPFAKMTGEEFEAVEPELITFNALWGRWAAIRVAIRGIKVVLEGGDLMDADLALLEWDNLEGVKRIPVDLFDALDTAAVQVNPRVFGRFIEDTDAPNERKAGVISAS